MRAGWARYNNSPDIIIGDLCNKVWQYRHAKLEIGELDKG